MNLNHTFLQAPFGMLRIESTDGQISSIQRVDRSEIATSKMSPVLEQCIEQLNRYFEGTCTTFDLPIRLEGTEFQKEVWQHLENIPFGKTTTYGTIAKQCGDFKKNRAVGMANGQNPVAIVIPCHRVIGADGSLTGYAGGLEMKKWLLAHEQKVTGTYQTNMFESKTQI